MADYDPPFANADGSKRMPTVDEIANGFGCGPADIHLFNGLWNSLYAELGHLLTYAGLTPSNADFQQVRKAIQQIVYAEAPADNLLINPEFNNDQRNRGDTPGAQAYKFYARDRWRMGPAGGTPVFSGPTITLNGEIEQIIEEPGLAAEVVTVCVDNPSGTIAVTLTDGTNTVSGSITAGGINQSVTLTVPGALSGDLTCRLGTSSAISFARPRLVRGNRARPFVRRPYAVESVLCHRYYWIPGRKATSEVNVPPTTVDGSIIGYGQAVSTAQAAIFFPFHVKMRAVPSLVVVAPGQFELLNTNAGSAGACSTITLGGATNRDAGLVNAVLGTTPLTAGQGSFLRWVSGVGSNFAFDAEYN